jgi:DNA-directed RNA polymerase specialized sigma24 family protein
MFEPNDVTRWIVRLTDGDETAAQAIWEQYFDKLVRLARKRLERAPRRVADEEDVALSAMKSFFSAAQKGRFPNLADRHDLWRLLMRMTARKVIDLKRQETRQKRGGGRVRGESALGGPDSSSSQLGLAQVIGDTPTPEFAAMMAEEWARLLSLLDDPEWKVVAVGKMQGYQNDEIASQLGWSMRTVERRLQLIRKKWQREAQQ